MLEPNGTPEEGGTRKAKRVGLVGVLVIVGSVVTAWLVGWGFLPPFAPPATILGIGIIVGMVLVCCTSSLFTMSVAMRIPGYGDLEIVFEEAMDHYNNEEWQEALDILKKVMGPELNHKRALFYAAKCSERLDDHDGVKFYLGHYMKMQPKDKEAWEMLANAHKRLFEYAEAEEAMQRAQQLD